MTEADSSSIPTLTDVLVPGKPVPARSSATDMPPLFEAEFPEDAASLRKLLAKLDACKAR